MNRLKDSILQKGIAYAGNTPALNLASGGQNGPAPMIGRRGGDGVSYGEWISNQAHVQQDVIPVVLSYPTAFDLLPDSQTYIDTWNALMTRHPETIAGLDSGISVEFDETRATPSGEMQSEPTKTTYAVSSVVKSYKEKNGKAIQKFVNFVIRTLYSDPDVGRPLIANLLPNEDFGGLYTPEFYTGTTIYIEPDVLHRRAVDAWLCSGQMFKGDGGRNGGRDLSSARKVNELSLELTGITTHNDAVLQLADSVLAQLGGLTIDPDTKLVTPVSGIAPALQGSSTGFGAL